MPVKTVNVPRHVAGGRLPIQTSWAAPIRRLMSSTAPVNQYERAFLAWPVLTSVASSRGTITYKQLSDRIGIHHRPVRFVLGVIQDYCLQEKLPPLTIVVVGSARHTPGEGFMAWDVEDLDEGYRRVYSYSWNALPNPFAFASDGSTPEQLADELLRRPDQSRQIYLRVRNRGIAQDVFREALLRAYGRRCAFCGLSIRPALQAAHIIPWTEASAEQRMAPSNGLLLCATHHALFDANVLIVTGSCKIACPEPDPRWADPDKRAAMALHGQSIALPADQRHRPSPAFLQRRLDLTAPVANK